MTATGSNIGTVTMWPPTAGNDVIVSVDAAWNIGVCSKNVEFALVRQRHQAVVDVHHLAALVRQHTLREAGRATGIHEHDRIGLLAFSGIRGDAAASMSA